MLLYNIGGLRVYTIVIVDDENSSYNMLQNFIKTHIPYFSVTECFSSAADALSYLTCHRTDVVITDIKMPEMDGIELTRCLREKNVNSKVIFLSGYDDFKYAKKAIEYGVSDYLLKPVNFSELSQTLERVKGILDNMHCADDELSDFFVKLFTDHTEDSATMKEEFLSLNPPFGLERFCGHILKLELDNYSKYIEKYWNYGSDRMDSAILNIVKMSVSDSYVFQIYSGRNSIVFVVVCSRDIEILSKIKSSLESTLPFSFNLQRAYTFSSFNEAVEFTGIDNTNLHFDDNLSDNDVITIIKDFLKSNYNKNIYLADIGATVNMNSVYLSRIFKQQTGMSPYEYHLSVRMNKAISLLMGGNKVEYIAKVLGYSDRRCFFRNFKSYTGYSPSGYKEMINKIDDEQF